MKLTLISVISIILISCGGNCDKIEENSSNGITEEKQNSTETTSVKIKRGISNYGYGSAFSYSLPPTINYGYHRGAHFGSPYSSFPGVYKNGYAITPGSASVHSVSVNYPRYNVLSPRPIVPVVGRPAFVPSVASIAPVAPLAPTPSFFLPQRPIIPASYPHYSNHFPAVFQRPYTPFVLQRPAFLPAPAPAPFLPAALPAPAFGPAPVSPEIPASPFPAAPFAPIPPAINGFNPLIPLPNAQPAIPTTINIPGNIPQVPQIPQAFPQPGFITPDVWRPIFINQPTPVVPSTPTTTISRPSVNLLPPHLQPASTNNPAETQPTPQIPDTTYLPQKPTTDYYLPPSTDQSGLDQTTQQHHASEDLSQAQERYEHQQQYQAYQLQQHLQNLHQQQQLQQLQQSRRYNHGRSLGNSRHTFTSSSLNSQGYELPSNNGRYTGLSSYEVPLGSRTRLHK